MQKSPEVLFSNDWKQIVIHLAQYGNMINVMQQNQYLQTALNCQISYGNDPMVSLGQAAHINSMLQGYKAKLPKSTIALLQKHATDLGKLAGINFGKRN